MTGSSDPVIDLGKRLADALDDSDIIGRWMSHHLADLITRSEARPTDQALAAETREVILRLWEHKAGGRFRKAPLDQMQRVLAALTRLEPDAPPWAHFRVFPANELPSPGDLAHLPVLELACNMDREFGRLVRLAVALASQSVLDREEAWVVAGTAVGGTEMDSVLRELQEFISAYNIQSEEDSEFKPADGPFEPADNELSELVPPSTAETSDQPSSTVQVLIISLRAAIARCAELLERFDRLVG